MIVFFPHLNQSINKVSSVTVNSQEIVNAVNEVFFIFINSDNMTAGFKMNSHRAIIALNHSNSLQNSAVMLELNYSHFF